MLLSVTFALITACYAQDNENPRQGYLPANESFVFHMNCHPVYWNTTRCNAAKVALQEIGTLIGQQLLFKKPVTVCIETDRNSKEFEKISEPYSTLINRRQKAF